MVNYSLFMRRLGYRMDPTEREMVQFMVRDPSFFLDILRDADKIIQSNMDSGKLSLRFFVPHPCTFPDDAQNTKAEYGGPHLEPLPDAVLTPREVKVVRNFLNDQFDEENERHRELVLSIFRVDHPDLATWNIIYSTLNANTQYMAHLLKVAIQWTIASKHDKVYSFQQIELLKCHSVFFLIFKNNSILLDGASPQDSISILRSVYPKTDVMFDTLKLAKSEIVGGERGIYPNPKDKMYARWVSFLRDHPNQREQQQHSFNREHPNFTLIDALD